jgi:hypothetical protein
MVNGAGKQATSRSYVNAALERCLRVGQRPPGGGGAQSSRPVAPEAELRYHGHAQTIGADTAAGVVMPAPASSASGQVGQVNREGVQVSEMLQA